MYAGLFEQKNRVIHNTIGTFVIKLFLAAENRIKKCPEREKYETIIRGGGGPDVIPRNLIYESSQARDDGTWSGICCYCC